MFQKVLVPLDGSNEAEGILPYVSHIASGLDISVALLSVMDHGGLDIAGEPSYSKLFERAEFEARNRLHNAAHQLETGNVRTEEVVVTGRAEDEVTAVADRLGCNLIAITTHGRSAPRRGILGSVTDKVIHTAAVPVLTITPDRARAYRRQDMMATQIVVPLDGSNLSESVLPYVRHLAGKLSWQVVLVRVVRPLHFLWAGDYPMEASEEHETLESRAEEYLENVAERLRGDRLDIRRQVLVGHPTTIILDMLREMPNVITVLASHARSGLRRWFIGTLAETLIRDSGDPVLMTPPREQTEQAGDDA